jgi:hypothetical protein
LQLYSAILSRILGDYSDPAALVPRTSRPELRHPRYVAYKTSLNKKMKTIRVWWLLRGVLITIAGFSKLGLAVKQQFFSGPFWPTWESVTSLPTSDASFTLAHPFLALYSSTGVASLVHRIGLVLYASLLRDHLGSPSPLMPQSIAFNFNLARAVMAALSATVLPLALAVLAAYTLCKWSALDFAVHRLNDIKGEGSEYRWETGSIGEHKCQVLPTRIVAAATATGTDGGDDASDSSGSPVGATSGAGAVPSRRANNGNNNASAAAGPALNLAKVHPSEPAAEKSASKYATPLLHYLNEGQLPASAVNMGAQQQGPTPRQCEYSTSTPRHRLGQGPAFFIPLFPFLFACLQPTSSPLCLP